MSKNIDRDGIKQLNDYIQSVVYTTKENVVSIFIIVVTILFHLIFSIAFHLK